MQLTVRIGAVGMVDVVLRAPLMFAQPASAQICVRKPSGLVHWWPGDGDANDVVGGDPDPDVQLKISGFANRPGR